MSLFAQRSRGNSRARSSRTGGVPAARFTPVLECLEGRTLLDAGALDPTFGSGGRVVTDFSGPLSAPATAVALQTDGKAVVVGRVGGDRFAVVRYNADGGVDPTFGSGGLVMPDFGSYSSYPMGIAVQSDGNIVVAGTAQFVVAGTGQNDFALARYTPTGNLDATFGTGGKVTTAFLGYDTATGIALQANGKLVVVGYSSSPDPPFRRVFALARYNLDGSLDTTFGTSGKVTTDLGPDASPMAEAVAVQTDGKIVVAGRGGFTGGDDFVLVRYDAAGRLDPTFGTGGKLTTDFGTPGTPTNDVVAHLVLQPDGRILAGGSTGGGASSRLALARYQADGSLDATFGSAGKVTSGFGFISALALQTGGRILVGGDFGLPGAARKVFALARYNADGRSDTTFGTEGRATTDFGNDATVRGVVLLPDGRIVAAGTLSLSAPSYRDNFALARYNADGGLDASFGTGGRVMAPLSGPVSSGAAAAALLSDGKLIVAGTTGAQQLALARYQPDGRLDASFGASGKVTTGFRDRDLKAVGLLVQADGKYVVLAEGASAPNSSTLVLVRYNPDGGLDAAFGTGGLVVTSLPGRSAGAIALLPEGRLLVAGPNTIARYEGNGSLDTRFGAGGLVSIPLSVSAQGLLVRDDGRIVLAGVIDRSITVTEPLYPWIEFTYFTRCRIFNPSSSCSYPSSSVRTVYDLAVARYHADGSPDPGFGRGGQVVLPGSQDRGSAGASVGAALQPDGKLVVAGASYPTGSESALVRYNVNGTLDTTFGVGGFAAQGASRLNLDQVVVQTDGRIVVAGSSAEDFALARYNPNGTLDATFGAGGTALTDFAGKADSLSGLVLQRDGKIVAVGAAKGDAGRSSFAVARYQADDRIADPAQRFVTQVYLDLLRRTPDPSGLAAYTAALNQGASRTQVAQSITGSLEYRTLVVQGLYGQVLRRAADPEGLNAYVNYLGSGGTMAQARAHMLGSQEYFQNRAEGTNEGFLSAVYRDVLNRDVEPAGRAAFLDLLARGTTRQRVAEVIFGSAEYQRTLMSSVYARFLRRQADLGGLNAFVAALQRGVNEEVVLAAFAGSNEYFGRL